MRCSSRPIRRNFPHWFELFGQGTKAKPHTSSCSLRRPKEILSWQPVVSISKYSSESDLVKPCLQWISKSSICPLTAKFDTKCSRCTIVPSRGHFVAEFPVMEPPFRMQFLQKVCPHWVEITGSLKSSLQMGHLSDSEGWTTNFVGSISILTWKSQLWPGLTSHNLNSFLHARRSIWSCNQPLTSLKL